jgi:cell wall-associated NlpC family hydrolase
VASQPAGRHRAPGRFNPVSEISGIVAQAAQPAVKTSAVLAASGGLVASFALPASAAPASSALTTKATAPTAAPVAVQAPETAAPQATDSFGLIGFEAVAKPKPKPKPKPVVRPAQQQQTRAAVRDTSATVSRSAERTAAPATTKDYSNLAPAAGGVLAIAAQYAGLPYRYGGTSPSTGFDCSGFTQYVFGRVGKSLPRTAEAQRQAATPVSNPQPGDLVFFGAPAYHVGIYAGNNQMWDSPRTGSVVSKRSIWTSAVTYGRP